MTTLNHPFAVHRRSKSWRLYVTDFPSGELHAPFTSVSLHSADGTVPVEAQRLAEDTIHISIGDHATVYITNDQARALRDQLNEIVGAP